MRLIRFAALAAATATILTNAYYLQFLEPAVSRGRLALVVIAVCAVVVAWTSGAWPRELTGWRELARRSKVGVALSAVLAVGLWLRLWGITAGLPQSYIADEYDFVHAGLRMMKGGDLNPHWWFHPSLQRYLAVATYSAVFIAGVAQGRWSHVAEITEEDMLYWGRFVGVVSGTATVLVAFLLGRRVFGPWVGVLGAGLLAVFPAAVEHSQYNKPDPVVALLMAVSVLVALVYLERGGKGLALACGVAVGLAVSAKYNGIVAGVAFLVAAAFRLRGRLFVAPDLYLAALGTVAGFLIGCPFALTEVHLFLDQFAYNISTYSHSGREGAEGVDNWANHGVYTSRFGAGYWATLAGVAGLVLALYRITPNLAVFLSFPVLYYGYYGSQRISFRGNLLPVYPFLAVLAAHAAVELVRVVRRRAGDRRGVAPVAAVIVLSLLFVPAVQTAVRFNRANTRRDTGSYAREWIEQRLPPGTHIALERFTPVLDRRRYKVTLETRLINRSVQSYRDEGVQYLVVSSLAYDRYGAGHNQTRGYQKIFALCPLVAEIPGIAGQRPGPTIRILQVPREDAS